MLLTSSGQDVKVSINRLVGSIQMVLPCVISLGIRRAADKGLLCLLHAANIAYKKHHVLLRKALIR